MPFVCTFSIMCAKGVRFIVMKKVRNYEKIVFIKNMFENDWWGDASPHFSLDPPLLAQITMTFTTTPTTRFGFSVRWGKFCQNCFEITARTALAQFGHFTVKTRVWFQKGGGSSTPQTPFWVCH